MRDKLARLLLWMAGKMGVEHDSYEQQDKAEGNGYKWAGYKVPIKLANGYRYVDYEVVKDITYLDDEQYKAELGRSGND